MTFFRLNVMQYSAIVSIAYLLHSVPSAAIIWALSSHRVCKNACTELAITFDNISKAYLSVRCRYFSKLMDVDQTLLTTCNYSLGMPSKFETKESNSSLKNFELLNESMLF